VDKKPHLVIGVLPPDFAFSVPGVFKPADMWAPAVLSRDNAQRGNFYLRVIARLKADVTMQQAQSALSLITQQLAQEYPQALSGVGARVVPLHEQMVGNARTGLLIMLGAVGFVLLIACANMAIFSWRAPPLGKKKWSSVRRSGKPETNGSAIADRERSSRAAGGALGMLLAEEERDFIKTWPGEPSRRKHRRHQLGSFRILSGRLRLHRNSVWLARPSSCHQFN